MIQIASPTLPLKCWKVRSLCYQQQAVALRIKHLIWLCGSTFSIGCALLRAPLEDRLFYLLLLIPFLWIDSSPSTATLTLFRVFSGRTNGNLLRFLATIKGVKSLTANESTSTILLKSFQSSTDEMWWNMMKWPTEPSSPPQNFNQVACGLYNNRSGSSEVPTASINGRSRRKGYGRIMGSSNLASCRVKQCSLKHSHQTSWNKKELSANAAKYIKTTCNFIKSSTPNTSFSNIQVSVHVTSFPLVPPPSVLAPAPRKDILAQDIQQMSNWIRRTGRGTARQQTWKTGTATGCRHLKGEIATVSKLQVNWRTDPTSAKQTDRSVLTPWTQFHKNT